MATLTPRRGEARLPMLVLLVAAAIPCAFGQARSVHGVVTDQTGEPLKGAIVKVKNTLNLHIRSYVTQAGGEYRFHGLHPDIEYQLKAKYRGQTGKTRTLHWYDSGREARIHLKVRISEDAKREDVGDAKGLREREGRSPK